MATRPDASDDILKIAVVLPHLQAGGIEKGMVRLLAELNPERVQCTLILGRREGPLLAELSPEIRMMDLGGRRAALSVPALARALELSGAQVVYAGTNARNLAVLAAVRLIRRAHRPLAVISEHTSPEAYLEKAKLPVLRRLLMRRLYPGAASLVAPLPGLGEAWLAHLGLSVPPVTCLPNPVLDGRDVTLSATVAAGAGPARDKDLVLAVGRLHPAKGHDVLIEAFARARAQRPALRLAIYGDGPERARLEMLVARLGLQEAVQLPGYSAGIPRELASAGLLALGSRREGFGNVVAEALAMGTPVVSARCAGPEALLEGLGAAGCVVDQGDVAGLGAAIARMAGDPAALAAAAGPGRARALGYTAEAAAAQFEAHMRGLLAQR